MNREIYSKWIREVRGTMTQIEFGKCICHFKSEKNTKVCKGYHRNEIANWEKGKSLPENIETFVSIALLDYDKKYQNSEKEIAFRNQRYQYVQKKMWTILGQNLYCRNIHDMLLIQVCRDVISFDEMLKLEPELEELVWMADMDSAQRREYALQRETEKISGNLLKIKERDEIIQLVEDSRVFFYTGNRTFGERLKKCFEDSDKEKKYSEKLSLTEAVRIYAPNYRDSFSRIFFSSSMTRQWMIDLCIHLRFERREIQDMLNNAYMIPLSDYEEDIEKYYMENEAPIGSACWYQKQEEKYPDRFPGHFAKFKKMTLLEKMLIALLLAAYVSEESAEGLPPIDYLLESFLLYDYGKKAMEKAERILEQNVEWKIDDMQDELIESIKNWQEYVQYGHENADTIMLRRAFSHYRDECFEYFLLPEKALKHITEEEKEKAVRLRYLAALLYTVFTGRYFKGTITDTDLREIKIQFEKQWKDWKLIYNFLNQFLLTFLDGQPLYRDTQGGFFVELNGKKTRPLDFKEIIADLWESLDMIKCTR